MCFVPFVYACALVPLANVYVCETATHTSFICGILITHRKLFLIFICYSLFFAARFIVVATAVTLPARWFRKDMCLCALKASLDIAEQIKFEVSNFEWDTLYHRYLLKINEKNCDAEEFYRPRTFCAYFAIKMDERKCSKAVTNILHFFLKKYILNQTQSGVQIYILHS